MKYLGVVEVSKKERGLKCARSRLCIAGEVRYGRLDLCQPCLKEQPAICFEKNLNVRCAAHQKLPGSIVTEERMYLLSHESLAGKKIVAAGMLLFTMIPKLKKR